MEPQPNTTQPDGMRPDTTKPNSLKGVGSELARDTKTMGTNVIERLHSEVDSRKDGGISQVNAVSAALEQTAGGLGEDAPAWIKSAFEQSAQQIQKFAGAIEQKDSRQLVNDVSDFARQSPTAFLAACAAAGFAAARVFKAGAPETDPPAFRRPQAGNEPTLASQPNDISTGPFQDANVFQGEPV